jgi:hypothetical protein
MYPGSCHPKSFAGLGKVEPDNFRTKGQNLSRRKRKENGVYIYVVTYIYVISGLDFNKICCIGCNVVIAPLFHMMFKKKKKKNLIKVVQREGL